MTTSDVRLELWTRPPSTYLYERREAVIDRIDDLVTAGVVDEATVETWDRQVPLSSTATRNAHEERVRERVNEFRAWADENDVEMPAFSSVTTLGRGRRGPEHSLQSLPAMALALYEDDGLRCVAPYTDGDEHVSVLDLLGRLRETESSHERRNPQGHQRLRV